MYLGVLVGRRGERADTLPRMLRRPSVGLLQRPHMISRIVAIVLTFSSALMGQSVHLPSSSPLFVLEGGDTPNVNHHMTVPSQAYAIDFGVVGGPRGRELTRGPATRAEDFFCWDTPVLSPVSGRVITALDSLPDNALGVKDATRPLGNHVVIQQGDRYFYVGHLRQHTVSVHAGDVVTAGQTVGHCGNSGNTDFPHIHVHATHSPTFGEGVGLNLLFGPMNVDLAGKTFEHVEWPLIRGLWLRTP